MRIGSGSEKRFGRNTIVARTACIASAILACNVAHAATNPATWLGTSSTNFEDPGNWIGGAGGTGTGATGTVVPTAPTPMNSADTTNTSGDIATFPTDPTTINNPNITAQRSIQGLLFNFPGGGYTLSGNAGATLTVGGNGISTVGQTSGVDNVSATLALSQTQSLLAGAGGTLTLTGPVSAGSGASGTASAALAGSFTVGSATATGTVVLDPGAGSDNFYTNAAFPTIAAAGGTLRLGSSTTSATSVNVIANSGSFGGIATASTTATIQVIGGIWETNDIAASNFNDSIGTYEIAGGTLATGGARSLVNYSSTGGGTAIVDGGNLIVTGGGNSTSLSSDNSLEIGITAATAGTGFTTGRVAQLNVTSGLVDVAKAGNNNQIGNIASATALINQDGGVVRFGLTTGTNVFTGVANSNTGNALVVGSGKTAGLAAYTLTGGKLFVAGILSGNTIGTGGINNFNFMGGQLSVGTINMTALSSDSAATFTGAGTAAIGTNQVAAGNNLGVLENYGGTLAPGDVGLSGRTHITGSYAGNGNGVLSFDIGGTTQATGFQNGTYDLLEVTGSTSLNDKLVVSLINGFHPSSATTFTIVTSTGGVSGAFTNLANGATGVTSDGSYDFTLNESTNAVALTGFTAVTSAPEPTTCTAFSFAAALLLRRRRKAAQI